MSFKLKFRLTRHTSEVHERKKSLQCKICDRSYTRKQKLNAHIEAIHEEKKLDCKLCGAKYGSNNNLMFIFMLFIREFYLNATFVKLNFKKNLA